jgi:hypothetical protein
VSENAAGICPDCSQPVRHLRNLCPAIVPPPPLTGDRTYVASPYTGLIYGSPDLWRDATEAFRSYMGSDTLGKSYYTFHLITDYRDLPSWARDLAPGENVDVASIRRTP